MGYNSQEADKQLYLSWFLSSEISINLSKVYFIYRDGEFAFKYTKKRKAEDLLAFMKK